MFSFKLISALVLKLKELVILSFLNVSNTNRFLTFLFPILLTSVDCGLMSGMCMFVCVCACIHMKGILSIFNMATVEFFFTSSYDLFAFYALSSGGCSKLTPGSGQGSLWQFQGIICSAIWIRLGFGFVITYVIQALVPLYYHSNSLSQLLKLK